MSQTVIRRTLWISLCVIASVSFAQAETRRQTALLYVQLGDEFVERKDFDRGVGRTTLPFNLILGWHWHITSVLLRISHEAITSEPLRTTQKRSKWCRSAPRPTPIGLMSLPRSNGTLKKPSRTGPALQINPKMKTVFNDRGNLRLRQGEVERALADFHRAVESDPNYDLAYNNRGIARVGLGDLDGAISDFTHAIKLNARFLEAYVNRGLVRLQQGMKTEAEKDFARAVELKPSLSAIIKDRIDQIKK